MIGRFNVAVSRFRRVAVRATFEHHATGTSYEVSCWLKKRVPEGTVGQSDATKWLAIIPTIDLKEPPQKFDKLTIKGRIYTVQSDGLDLGTPDGVVSKMEVSGGYA